MSAPPPEPGPSSVDVILPTHRRPHTIAFSIASALAQTHGDFTLHVVGDGCDAETERVVRSFGDPRVRFHRFPKAMGFGYAHRNAVLRESHAPFVAYITDDDLWFPDHLERGLAELADDPALGLVAFRSIQVRFPDVLDPFFFAYDWRLGPVSRWLRNWFMGSVGCVHRRSVFDLVGYWNDQLFRFGDREFYNRVRVSSVRSRYVDGVTVLRFYAQHWDGKYDRLPEPPQKEWLPRLRDPEWREAVRRTLAGGARGWPVRRRQAADFFAFGARSGPRFARFLYQTLTTPDPARA